MFIFFGNVFTFMTVPTITYYTFIALVPCFYFLILEILVKKGSKRKSAWIDDDVRVDVNHLLEMECVACSNEHRINERQSIFIRFGLWEHINPIGFGYLFDEFRFCEQNRSDIELFFIQRQNSESKAQFVRNHLDNSECETSTISPVVNTIPR